MIEIAGWFYIIRQIFKDSRKAGRIALARSLPKSADNAKNVRLARKIRNRLWN